MAQCPECNTLETSGNIYVSRRYTHRTLYRCDCCQCRFSDGPDGLRVFYRPDIDKIDELAFEWEFWTDDGDDNTVRTIIGMKQYRFPIAAYEAMQERKRIDKKFMSMYDTTKPSPEQLRHFWLGGGGG